jgi:hypothetical protein
MCGYEKSRIAQNVASIDYNLLLHNPKLCEEWNYEKNDKRPESCYPYSDIKVWWKCSKCNYEWQSSISNRNLLNRGCPQCNNSNGERIIYEYLETNNIKFMLQYKFDDCKSKKSLPFDFAIFDNNNLKCLIEYQGQQHYEPIKYFGGVKKFEETKKRDQIKLNYCLQNNIPFLCIPYTEFNNIEAILNNFLLLNNQIKAVAI